MNCAALHENLLESELFGHERGAFTGAEKLRIGRFEQADKGTIFLDEIGDMSATTQAKVLRVLQEQEFERLGSSGRSVKVDVRVLTATNKDLRIEVKEGRFRQDLYFRLNVVNLRIPPLRERLDDILPLARFFLNRYAVDFKKRVSGFSPEAIEKIRGYSWPGNVRELQNSIERAVLLSDSEIIAANNLTLEGRAEGEAIREMDTMNIEELERGAIQRALSADERGTERGREITGGFPARPELQDPAAEPRLEDVPQRVMHARGGEFAAQDRRSPQQILSPDGERNSSRNALQTSRSNKVFSPAFTILAASSWWKPSRYGRRETSESKYSDTERIRAVIEMSSPRRPKGYPVPSKFSWCSRIVRRATSIPGTPSSIFEPRNGCFRTNSISSSLRFPVFARMPPGIPTIPTSCSAAACRSGSRSPFPRPIPLTDPDGEIADPVCVPRQEGETQLQRPGNGGEDREGEGSDVFVECHPLRKDLRDLRRDRPEGFQVFPGEGLQVHPVRQVKHSEGLPVMRQGKGQERLGSVPVLREGVPEGESSGRETTRGS